MDEEVQRLLAGVGPRLRMLRRQRGLTLAGLAEQTGISVSVLSRLESGKRRPTLELLLPIARAHRLALDQLIDAPLTGDPRVTLAPQLLRGSVIVPLTRHPVGMQVFKQIVTAREPAPVSHTGFEWLFVLAGQLRLLLGTDELTLHPGDLVEFDTHEPHWFGCASEHPAEILHIFGPHGERPRLRARPREHRGQDGGHE